VLGVSAERVRQLEASAIRKLKVIAASRGIRSIEDLL
jgi:DNA-directed RNA polymerase sigma subunit (sigma70/sigma32)